MKKKIVIATAHFFSQDYEPSWQAKVILPILPLVLFGFLYMAIAEKRHAENPDDKLMPYPAQMYEAARHYVLETDARTDTNLFVKDTLISLQRFWLGLAIFAFSALISGILLAQFPWIKEMWTPSLVGVSILPALAILPILLIIFDVQEVGKVAIIVLGNLFSMIRDINTRAKEIPVEQRVKARTLGAGSITIFFRVTLPQIMPRFWETVQVYLNNTWVYLITAEFVAAQYGLAARILLQRRTSNMALIIPIVLWMVVLGYLFNLAIKSWINWRHKWYAMERKK